jgi:hypothetical protein
MPTRRRDGYQLPANVSRPHRLRWLLVALLSIVLLGLPSHAAALDPVLTDAEKQDLVLDMIEDYVQRAERFWIEDAEFSGDEYDISATSGYYWAGGWGVSQVRGEMSLAVAYATLLEGRDQATYGPTNVPKSTLEDHLEQAILHAASLHETQMADGEDDFGWGLQPNSDWQAATKAQLLAWAAQLHWNSLEEDTQELVEVVVAAEANAFLGDGTLDTGAGEELNNFSGGNSGAEENQSSAGLMAAAAAVLPGHEDAGAWEDAALVYSYNVPSRAADELDSTVLDGDQVSDWVQTANIKDDYTLINHGFFHPTYEQGVYGGFGEMNAYYASVSKATPSAFHFRLDEVWDEVLGRLVWDDGDIVMPSGTDWARHDYQHILYLATVAVMGSGDRDEVASVLESRATELLARRQADHTNQHTGSLLGQGADAPNPLTDGSTSGIGYELDILRNLSSTWWVHQEVGDAPEPTPLEYEEAREDTADTRWHPHGDVIIKRQRDALVTMLWNDQQNAEPMGLVVPSDEGFEDDPVLISYETNRSLLGDMGEVDTDVAAYNCDCDQEEFFSAAGRFTTPADKKFSMTSFDDGVTLLLDRSSGETFTVAFEDIPGIADPTPAVDHAGGTWTWNGGGSISGDWFNVGDRYGMVVKGGAGIDASLLEESTAEGDDYPRNSRILVRGSTGTGSGNRGALVLPVATEAETSGAEPDVDIAGVSDSNWSAMSARAPDGTARVAVARWGGSSSATITLTSTLGVPIPDRPNDVTVSAGAGSDPSTGTTVFSLGNPLSIGHTGYFWVDSSATVTTRPTSETRLTLTNGGSSNTITVWYDDGAGSLQSNTQTLAANEVAYAVTIDGGVSIVRASATTTTGGFPASLAYDLNTLGTDNWWSSTAQTLSTNPQDLRLDFGRNVDLNGLTMTPVSGSGPQNYSIQGSTNASCGSGSGFSTITSVTGASSSSATNTVFGSTTVRCIQIHITSAHGTGPPHTVKVRELAVSVG